MVCDILKATLDHFAVYDYDGNLKGYFINQDELDEIGKKFFKWLGCELKYISKPTSYWSEYEIIPPKEV